VQGFLQKAGRILGESLKFCGQQAVELRFGKMALKKCGEGRILAKPFGKLSFRQDKADDIRSGGGELERAFKELGAGAKPGPRFEQLNGFREGFVGGIRREKTDPAVHQEPHPFPLVIRRNEGVAERSAHHSAADYHLLNGLGCEMAEGPEFRQFTPRIIIDGKRRVHELLDFAGTSLAKAGEGRRPKEAAPRSEDAS
jgi:hypothetical protein